MPFDSTLLTLNPLQLQFAQQPTLLIRLCPPHGTLQTPAASCMREGPSAPSLPQQQEKGQVDTVAAREHRDPMLLLKDTIHTVDHDRTKIWEMKKYALSQK